jgi:poly-gamma-glutamate capsule biosynthesis protein CapA/YwtB (metallophosphatase superfamily)
MGSKAPAAGEGGQPLRGSWRPLALVTLMALVAMGGNACSSTEGRADDGSTSTGAPSTDAPTTASTAPPTTRPLRAFTIAGAGDILLHNYVIAEGRQNAGGNGYNFDPMFDEIRDRVSAADLAICHQETPISADNTNLTAPRTKVFNAPHEIATALKNAGFDACDTASNHTWDQGAAGVQQTLDMLDAAGLGHAGSWRNAAEAAVPSIYDVKGVKVGHLAFSYTIFNSGGPTTTVPDQMPWLRDMLWPAIGVEGILAQARRAKEHGAEFVVVSIHWGAEYQTMATPQQRELAGQLLASPDIDLILGDHVHVVQPCEQIQGKYVIYGMGNFLSNQSPDQDSSLRPANEDGTLNTFTVQETSPGVFHTTAYELTPTRVMIPTHRIVPSTPDRFRASYDRTVGAVNLLNQSTPGACAVTPAF